MNPTHDERHTSIESAKSEIIQLPFDRTNSYEYQEKFDAPSPSTECIQSELSSKTLHSEEVPNSNLDQDSKSNSECIVQSDSSPKSTDMGEKVENYEFATEFPEIEEDQSEESKKSEEAKVLDDAFQFQKDQFTLGQSVELMLVEVKPTDYKFLRNVFFWMTLVQAVFLMILMSSAEIRSLFGTKFSEIMSFNTRALAEYDEDMCPADPDEMYFMEKPDYDTIYEDLKDYKIVVNEMQVNLKYTIEILDILSSTGSKIQIKELKSLMSQWEATIRNFSQSKSFFMNETSSRVSI
jgi:hypothetical protein